MSPRGRSAAALVAAALAGLAPAAADAREPTCRTTTVKVAAGKPASLALDCSVTARGRVRALARGRSGRATRTITAKPRHGRLSGFSANRGVARYTPTAGFAGTDVVRYRVRLPDGRRYRAALRLKVAAAVTPVPPVAGPAQGSDASQPTPEQPAAATPSPGEAATPGDSGGAGDLPAELPAATGSVAATTRAWQPTVWDTCPKSLHDRYAVIGPDSKRYPTWHPPSAVDPATGKPCTFGHEHGLDPRGSDLYDFASRHLSYAGREKFAGVPFGLATEALNDWARDHPGTPTRQEDHVGYKVDYENDVRLVGANGGGLGVTCDYLTLVHQGSHSPDATANNVHELLHAVRCSDGTELVSSTIARFGSPGEYTRSCDPSTVVATTPNGYPAGTGARAIPDRNCVEANFLVPPGRSTSIWALYEKWSAQNSLRTADPNAPPLARFDTAFGVFNPSRYADPAASSRIGRSIDLCWEREANGDRADGVACDESTGNGSIPSPYGYDDPRSEFNGTYRDVYLRQTDLANAGGPARWYTDPYGGNASTTPFPGAICQLVGTGAAATPEPQEQVFGRNRSADVEGVHAPN